MQLAKQASRNDAVRPNPPVQIGEVISDHILSTLITVSSLNPIQRLKSLSTLPNVLPFRLVYRTPFLDDGGDFARQITFADAASGNFDQSLKSLVCHMNVRWRMVVVPHADDDAKEDGEGWH